MKGLSHSKKRNLGLCYEFLTREVSSAIVAEEPSRAAAVLEIVRRHLAEGCILYEELSLHRRVMESKGVGERLARRIVDEIRAAGVRLSANAEARAAAKTALIHEMNKVLGKDVFDRYRISDYTAHASVNILMSRGLGGRLDEGVDVARVEDHLIEFLTAPAQIDERFNPDASLYAYKVAVGLFEREYGPDISDAQHELLREYVRVSLGGNPAPFERTFDRQRQELRESLHTAQADDVFMSDKDMMSRLVEAVKELDTLTNTEEGVERLMMLHSLAKEINS
jgi:hypothetical protein